MKIINQIESKSTGVLRFYILILTVLFSSMNTYAQELEPRLLTNVPVGMNFLVIGYGYAQGNILLDPSVPLEDLNSNLHTVVGAYLRSIKIFGLSGKVDVVIPWASGNWEGYYTGIDTSRSVSGFGDARFRLSVNFLGSPPLKKEEFAGYHPSKVSGFSLQVFTPTGQYDPDRLINLGSNRWVFRPQWGFSDYIGKWIIETYISAWLFTLNRSFFGGNELKQKPLGALKFHLIRAFPKNWWLALDAGYGLGGRTYVNGEERDARISTFRFGLTFAIPFGLHHTVRITGITGVRLERGSDFDAVAVSYQYRWVQ